MHLSLQHTSKINVHRKSLSRGFTLVEVLIATAIVLFMVLMLGQVLSSIQGMWRKSEARTDPFRDARAAIDLMARDLTVVVTNDKAPVLALKNVYSQSNDSKDGPTHNQQVYALVPMKNTSKSDICAVGFYCTWDSTKHAYILRRHFLGSDDAFTRLQSAGLPGAPAPVGAGSVYTPSNPATSPAQDENIANYVWDLKIVPYNYSGGALAPDTTYPITYYSALPQFLEISFKAISPQAAKKLGGASTGTWFDTTSSTYQNQILPDMHQFSTRIKLLNAASP
jgi:prepilin-type N-terminal cleavage/methylation domain-containing protein